MHATRWEYKVEDLKSGFLMRNLKEDALTELLNRHGAQGWELVNIGTVGVQMKLFFKRAR